MHRLPAESMVCYNGHAGDRQGCNHTKAGPKGGRALYPTRRTTGRRRNHRVLTERAFRIGKRGGAMMPKTIPTMARAYQQICAGEDPGSTRMARMPISYTNRKGLTYTLYRGQTKTGKPRYYFGRTGQGQGEPVTELPPGFTISESVNGVVSLVKDRPSPIQPEEVVAVEAAVQQHPEARRYRVAVKNDRIEIYERVGPDYEAVVSELHLP